MPASGFASISNSGKSSSIPWRISWKMRGTRRTHGKRCSGTQGRRRNSADVRGAAGENLGRMDEAGNDVEVALPHSVGTRGQDSKTRAASRRTISTGGSWAKGRRLAAILRVPGGGTAKTAGVYLEVGWPPGHGRVRGD